MTTTITAFERSPDGGWGLAHDMRVRWALEEVSQPYEILLVSFADIKEPAHPALNPFGQIRIDGDRDLALFGAERACSISRNAIPAHFQLKRTSEHARPNGCSVRLMACPFGVIRFQC